MLPEVGWQHTPSAEHHPSFPFWPSSPKWQQPLLAGTGRCCAPGWMVGTGPGALGVATPTLNTGVGHEPSFALLCLPSLLCLACTPSEPPTPPADPPPRNPGPLAISRVPCPPPTMPCALCLEPVSSGVAVPICPHCACMSVCPCRPAAALWGGQWHLLARLPGVPGRLFYWPCWFFWQDFLPV